MDKFSRLKRFMRKVFQEVHIYDDNWDVAFDKILNRDNRDHYKKLHGIIKEIDKLIREKDFNTNLPDIFCILNNNAISKSYYGRFTVCRDKSNSKDWIDVKFIYEPIYAAEDVKHLLILTDDLIVSIEIDDTDPPPEVIYMILDVDDYDSSMMNIKMLIDGLTREIIDIKYNSDKKEI